MSGTSAGPVYTELDEERFKVWISRLEESYRKYSAEQGDGNDSLLETIQKAIENDVSSFPSWISENKNIPAGKIASSSNDMKLYLRHVAFPHVLASYGRIIDEMCGGANSTGRSKELSDSVEVKPEPIAEAAGEGAGQGLTAEATPVYTVKAATLHVPFHTAPVSTKVDSTETAVEDFFRGLVEGRGDGLVNMCKLADIAHRINRADEHDTQQVAHWIESEKGRREGNLQNLAQREQRLTVLRGEDEGRLMEQSVGKLKSEINVLNGRLAQAVMEEDEARKAYEAAVQRRKNASQNIVSLENYIDNVDLHRGLLKKVNELRLEADRYNIASAEKRVAVFEGVRGYVHGVKENFVQRRLAKEMPELFANLASQIAAAGRQCAQASEVAEQGHVVSDTDLARLNASDGAADGSLPMFIAARVGLETIRIWKQLNLHVAQSNLQKPIDEFQSLLQASLAAQAVPSSSDPSARNVYRASNSTVVLFFDHLHHDTPEDHVEAQSRVLTCLKMLTDHLVDEPPHAPSAMDVVEGDGEGSASAVGDGSPQASAPKKPVARTMQLLNCNDILAPPVWCLPLAHSPQYLAQLWRLAEEAHSGDLYVPLEFDTEWISEDPYHSSSEDEGLKRARNPAPTGNLMRSVDFEEPWQHALGDLEKDAFTKLLTPAPADHIVAKVIKRMESRAAAKAVRAPKAASLQRSRQDERSASTASLASAAGAAGSSSPPLLPAPVVVRPEMEGAAVKTPMGPGAIVLNYRRDGMVSVKLEWGAVGHFRKECIEFPPAPVGPNSQNKIERPSYSSAQAFYVSGSAGRFVYNDMELHNTMCRLISLARVQRVIGDLVAINHANLSLYMHGRTSSGLTRTIEATITRWLEKFDEHRLAALLDRAEAEALRGAQIEPKEFIRLLHETAMPPGQISTVRSDRSLGRQVGLIPSPLDAPPPAQPSSKPAKTAAVQLSSNSKQSTSKPVPPAAATADAPFVPPSPAKAGAESLPSPTKVKQERTKSVTDVRTLPRYSKDGETLRELMSSLMRTLKLSQGSLANEYYRCFRYETSQGGVSAWFYFRGNSVTFEGMNHCALMWVDDHKQYLSAEEQKTFAELNARMSHNSPKQSEHRKGIAEATEAGERTERSETEAGTVTGTGTVDTTSLASVVEETETGTTAASVAHSAVTGFDSVAWAEVEPLPVPSAVAGSDVAVDPMASEEDGLQQDETAAEAEEDAVLEPEESLSEEPEAAADDDGNDGDESSDNGDEGEEVQGTGLVGAGGEEDGESLGMDVDAPTSPTVINPVSPAVNSAEKSPSLLKTSNLALLANGHAATAATAQARAAPALLPHADGFHEVKVENDPSTATPLVDSEAVVSSDDLPAPHGAIRTIEDLHKTVVYEMARRKVSQSRAAVEANLRDLGMGQPALSKFLSVATINNNERGKLFSGGMINWVKYSRTQPSAEGWDPSELPPYRPPVPPKPKSSANGASTATPTMSTAWVQNVAFQPVARGPGAEDPAGDDNSLASDDDDDETDTRPAGPSGGGGGGSGAGGGVGSRGYVRPSAKVPTAVHRNEKGEEELTCGLCGKLSTEFANYKSFRMHLAWCYRRNSQGKAPSGGALQSGANVVEWDAQGSRKRKTLSNDNDAAKRQRQTNDFAYSQQQISADALRDTFIVSADSYEPGFHYETCEVCHEHGEVILCDSCPCIYHLPCAGVREIPTEKWHCPKCLESGAHNGQVLPEEKKNDPSLAESWVLVYSSTLHRWRKAVVLGVHPDRRGIILVKWWRSDNKGGKTNWVDVAKVKVLLGTPERASLAPSRSRGSSSRPGSSTATAAGGSRERSQIVRFDPTAERKPSSARFKEGQHGAMLRMDGEDSGAVPPLIRASAAGVGGVGALREDEYPEGTKSTNISGAGMSDTYISSNSLKAALCAAGSACRAVDISICNENTNVFACTRPPGHHAGRYGCTSGCLSTGFCMLNNAAIAAIYARVRWGLERVAVVDIDVHFGNGTAELLRNDPNAFFASVHMIYGEDNDGLKTESSKRIKTDQSTDETGKLKKTRAAESLGFYPARMGLTEVTDTYVSVGVYPTGDSRGGDGARRRKKVVVTYDSESGEEVEAETAAGAGAGAEDVEEGEGEAMEEGADAVPTADGDEGTPSSPSKAPRPSRNASTASLGSAAAEASRRPFVGAAGFLAALRDVIIPQMEAFNPQLLIISAGFDGYVSDPLGGQLCLSLEDYTAATKLLMGAMDRLRAREPDPSVVAGKVISLLEGGYDTSPYTLGLAKCVDAHVIALQEG